MKILGKALAVASVLTGGAILLVNIAVRAMPELLESIANTKAESDIQQMAGLLRLVSSTTEDWNNE